MENFQIKYEDYNEKLQDLLRYCRATEIHEHNGYMQLRYHCDPKMKGKHDTTDSCGDCPKAGCHIHTTAQDIEIVLNGEKKNEETAEPGCCFELGAYLKPNKQQKKMKGVKQNAA